MAPLRRDKPALRSGFSLVETAFATLLVGGMLVAAVSTVGSAARTRRARADAVRARALAQHLLTEILQAAYEDPDGAALFGPEADEVAMGRSAFDDVDDYHGLSESPPRRRDGSALAGFAGWTRQCTVTLVLEAAAVLEEGNLAVATGESKRIAVTVTSPLGDSVTLYGLRTEEGVQEPSPNSAASVATWAGVEIEIGAKGDRVASGTQILNRVVVP